ncbi:hypothetical protein [Paludisphaera borealis]|uniref:hypothetical protein n=1 Tax=Paludisphaera borealis TaxID=1387353 RepID=UPI0011AB5DC2|nr:hypothetical protein [Paludisphaera borealis]
MITETPATGVANVYEMLKSAGIVLNMAYNLDGETILGHYLQSLVPTESTDDGIQWDVVGTFAQYDPTQTGGENPLNAKTQWTMRPNIRQIPVDVDSNGVPVRNSAGQRFTQPLTRDYNDGIINVVRNEASIDPALLAAVEQKVNDDLFLGVFPAKTCRFVSAEVSNGFGPDGTPYVTVQYQFALKWSTWVVKLLDQGTVHLESGKQKPNYSSGGVTIKSDPSLLDGSGGLLADGADPVYREFEPYEAIDFSIFNFVL